MNTIKLEDKYQLPTYHKFPLVINKGKGAYVWDDLGNKYLDFYGGHAVALVGHSHPEVVKAASAQMKKLIFYSNVVYNDQRAQAAKKLVSLTKGAFSSVFFCNSGTEANETALKLAKKYTGKNEVITFIGSFHGRTIGALSVTGGDKYKKNVGSLVGGVKFAKYGDIGSVKKALTADTAAIIVEAIQSIAGVNMGESGFYQGLRKLATEKGIVLIFDEVQTGLGRTGKMFFGEHHKVVPDMITLAKGIAGGLPAGAVLVSGPVTGITKPGDQGCTFGGGPVICAAINATIDIILKENLVSDAQVLGNKLKEEIKLLPHVEQVKGKGLLLGILLDMPAKEIQQKLLDKSVLAGTSDDPNVLRLMPPLIITEKEVELFIHTLKGVLI